VLFVRRTAVLITAEQKCEAVTDLWQEIIESAAQKVGGHDGSKRKGD
jgi:hypothetical protein